MAFRATRTYLCWSVGCSFCFLGGYQDIYATEFCCKPTITYHQDMITIHRCQSAEVRLLLYACRAVLCCAVKTQDRNNKVALIDCFTLVLYFARYRLLTTTHACLFSTEFGRIFAFSVFRGQTLLGIYEKCNFATDHSNSLTLQIIVPPAEIKETN
jgi:hypothetical protein